MAEYLIQEETLTAIADAIRAKTSVTSDIPTTSMADEILSIATTALPDGITAIAAGSFTPASDIFGGDSGEYLITHNLGVVPNFFIIHVRQGAINYADRPTIVYTLQIGMNLPYKTSTGTICKNCPGAIMYMVQDGTVATGTDIIHDPEFFFTDETIKVGTTANRRLKAGLTYYWIAGRSPNLL